MASELQSRIISNELPEDFIGRGRELMSLTEAGGAAGTDGCTILYSAPGAGSTELLKQSFDRVFRERSATPVYFSIDRSDRTARGCVRRFLYQVCVQAVAFGRRDTRIMTYSPTLDELERLAMPSDIVWLSRVIDSLSGASADDPEYSLASSLGTAVRSADSSAVLFFVDHLNEAEFIDGGDLVLRAFNDISAYPQARFVFSALRRSRISFSNCRQVQLETLSRDRIGEIVEIRSRRSGMKVTDQARDLIAAQSAARPAAAVSLVRAAAENGSNLETFREVQKLYTDELVGGSAARYFDSIIADAAAHQPENEKNIVSVLHDLLWGGSAYLPVEKWENLSGLGQNSARGLSILNTLELVTFSSGRIEAASENTLLADYIDSRFRLEVGGGNRALVVGDSLSRSLKGAPALMAGFYRRDSALGLRELLSSFEAASVPAELIDYGKFRDEFKGAPDAEILADVRGSDETVQIPQIVQTVDTERLYKPIALVAERNRSAVGRGFDARRYSDEDEVAWLAAEIDSKLPAPKELADYWCDRLEMAALFCNFTRYKIWLIAPEGFSAPALERLGARNALGSSRRQAELLRQYLSGAAAPADEPRPEEYELIVPMGDETELIAAHAVEEIARRRNMDAKSINQIKTALVEACINATEHSKSPDRKIYQKFAFDDEKITITISNRGLRLGDRRAAVEEPTEGRRGWGLALMRRLMDEVTVEDVDDGTSISMTKYLPRTA